MGCDSKPYWSIVLPLLVLVFCLSLILQRYGVVGEPQVPCAFIMGDSLSDNGNNNNLPTLAKVNYSPYGIDYPLGATGRFTNGKTSIDYIIEFEGFNETIPPYANTSGSDILQGVNYASGAAGIRAESGKQLGANIDLGSQLKNHITIVSKFVARLGSIERAQTMLNKCMYYVNIGSNDYINNYFMPQIYPTSQIFTLQTYADDLIRRYNRTIMDLHELGARKFVLVGLGQLGCTPDAISKSGNNTCDAEKNNAAVIFNSRLKPLVDQLNTQHTDSKFIFINSSSGTLDASFGFTNFTGSCCKVNGIGQCVPNETPCANRNKYVFFDGFHPTQAVNLLTAIASYNASDTNFTYPFNISTLLRS